MYAAIDGQSGQLIYACEVQQPSNYQCPKCQQVVDYKLSKRSKPYFAHRVACGSQPTTKKSDGETLNHQQAKQLLARLSTNAQVEHYLPALNQHVDVYLAKDGPAIFEYQQSKIPSQLLKERHLNYLTHTSHVYWLLAQDQFLSDRISKWHKTMLYYSSTKGWHWYVLDLSAQQLRLEYQLPILFHAQSFQYASAIIDLSLQYDQLPRFQPVQSPKRRVSNVTINSQRERQMIQQSEPYRYFLLWLHQQGYTLKEVPNFIFNLRWQCLLIDSPCWMMLTYLWVRRQQTGEKSKPLLNTWLNEGIALGWVVLHDLPLAQYVSVDQQLIDALWQFIKNW